MADTSFNSSIGSLPRDTQPNKNIGPDSIAIEVDKMISMVVNSRRIYERKWYEANFFDDGFHFRYVSRTTGKIMDVNDASSMNMPQRAIPKASRQIRGIANLLLAPKYVPVVYPERVEKSGYGQDAQAYQDAYNQAKFTAQQNGAWLEEEWRDQYMRPKLTSMLILAAKHSVSYLKIWPNAEEESIQTDVKDAFDIYLMGNLKDIEESPFVIEATPVLISEIKANPLFPKEQTDRINPDNKYASSEIKQAYMQARFGGSQTADEAATLLLKEAFIKTRISEDNLEDIMSKTKDPDILAGKPMGSTIMHHVFCAGGVYLLDEYLDLQEYPYVDYRYEPGLMYQRALIDMFIPANKSLDIIISRLEKWANTMVTGIWVKRKGENFEISNVPGGQVIEYTQQAPVQAPMANVPPAIFELIGFFNQTIEEQGASTSALGALPSGVKSGVAIESVKATEYANLEIASEQLKNTIERISKKMLYIADNYITKSKSTSTMKNGSAEYFDVIGKRSADTRNQLAQATGDTSLQLPQGVVVINGKSKVRIEIESGLGFTMEGKKQTMQQIIGFMMQLAQQGVLTTDAIKVLVQKFLEVYQFGSTQEFMEAMDSGTQTAPLNEEQVTQMKVAMVEALKDSGVVGPAADQKLVDSTKVGAVEALKDTGLLDQMGKQPEAPKGPSESISFKDLPASGKSQMAYQAGIDLSPEEIQAHEDEQAQKIADQKITTLKGASNGQ